MPTEGALPSSPDANAESTLCHLQRALESLRKESPRAYAAVARALHRAPTRYRVGTERFTLTADHGRITAEAGWRTLGTLVDASLPPQAIVDLVDGTATVERLIACEVVRIAAEPRALLALEVSVRTVARVGIVSRVLQDEFGRYREWVLSLSPEERRATRIR